MVLATEPDLVARPDQWEPGQDFPDPTINPRIAEEDQVRSAHILFRHVAVILHGQVAAVVTPPLIGEAPQARLGPGPDGRVPGPARPPDAEEARGELKERLIKGEKVPGVSITSRKGARVIGKEWLYPDPKVLISMLPAKVSEAKAREAWPEDTPFPEHALEQMPGSTYVTVRKAKEALK